MRLAQQRQETDAEKREAESALAQHLEEMQEHVANLTHRMHADQVNPVFLYIRACHLIDQNLSSCRSGEACMSIATRSPPEYNFRWI